jgi:hypothetical protein
MINNQRERGGYIYISLIILEKKRKKKYENIDVRIEV